MLATPPVPRRRLAAILAALAVVVAACGGSTTPTGAASAGAPSVAASAEPPASTDTGASPAASAGGLHRRPRHDHVLDLGRSPGDRQPDRHRGGVPRGQPGHHGQRRRVRLGRLLGQAPDRARRRRGPGRVRDGRAAVPRLPGPRRAARPQAVDRPRRVRPDPARRAGGRRLHHRRRRPVRDPARPEHDRPLLQQGPVRRGRDPVPRRHVGLGQAHRGRQAAHEA